MGQQLTITLDPTDQGEIASAIATLQRLIGQEQIVRLANANPSRGSFIAAIKETRTAFHLSLKEAKNLMDAFFLVGHVDVSRYDSGNVAAWRKGLETIGYPTLMV